MIYSANYSLKEPQKNVDLADVNDINYNTEAIDGLIHNTQISLAPAYDQTSTYDVDDLVMYENLLYKCITAITVAEAWDSTKWERAYLSENAGGGGNANVTEITYTQYQALTPAEKANGTIYAVTNDPNDSSSGGGGGGVNYSTTEQDTGLTWVDGKPIYQKTFSLTFTSNFLTVDLTALNIENVVKIEGGVCDSLGGFIPFGYESAVSAYTSSAGNMSINNSYYGSKRSGYTTICYTKATSIS